ncbi:toxin-antitoxin system, toxin component [Streptomyces sp. H34-S4]|uniref:toxin-antitoxin system, toxin component n=1 Tax=Streptomyces sp. H34-S4 TaxID=2996463 RepID=UPI00226F9B30|nr:toxin-antitoxin system, toxin component [Streptomyces sp. H34-S4]MCY0935636.1 toxin-antitoxin system, toxin component [Streptomyces sp. H34-S4]
MGIVWNRRRGQQLEGEMVRLCDELYAGLGRPAPSDIDELIARISDHLTVYRGDPARPVRIVRRDFPQGLGPVSGLWLDRETEDVIVVAKSTSPFHALVILGHEIWHMVRGHHGTHVLGAQVATRLLGDDVLSPGELHEAVRLVAARTHAFAGDEAEAEQYGRMLGRRFRHLVEFDPAQRVLEGPAARIQASLGDG